MQPNITMVLQALLCAALLFACRALGAETPKTTDGEAATVDVDGLHGGDSKTVKHGYSWGINGGASHNIGKGYSWQYKGGHGLGWSGGFGGCKLGCCGYFAEHCKYCCQSVQEAQAYKRNNKAKP